MAFIKNISLCKAKSDGTPITTPTVVTFCPKDFSLKEDSKYSDINCLLSRTPDRKRGTPEFSGAIGFNMVYQIMPIIGELFYGTADTTVNATSQAWAASTVMAVGDIVNHTNGKSTMTVIRVTATAKTGATIPSVTIKNDSEIVTDNDVVWEVTPLAKKYNYSLKDSAPKFVVEYEINDDGVSFYKSFYGCELSTLPIKISASLNERAFSCDVKATTSSDSTKMGYTPIASTAGAKTVVLGKDYYSISEDDVPTSIGGNTSCLDNVEATLDKGISVKKGLNGCAVFSRQEKITGKIDLEFKIEEFKKFKNEEEFDMEINFKETSMYSKFVFYNVTTESSEADLKTKNEVMLSPNIFIVDKGTTLSSLETVSPVMLDSTGAIVAL